MNICVDVGNTTICFGFFNKDKLLYKETIDTFDYSKKQFVEEISSFLDNPKIKKDECEHIIYSSVVPSIDVSLCEALKKLFPNTIILNVNCHLNLGVSIDVDEPESVGQDLLADLVGLKEKYGYPSLIVDLGTATKVLLIDKDCSFKCCVIMPGVEICSRGLSFKTELLPKVKMEKPLPLLQARNTKEAIKAGLLYGHLGMIKEVVERYENELGYKVKKVITGGASIHLSDFLPKDYIYDQDIILDGLNYILNKNLD